MTALKDLLDALGNPNRTDDYKYIVLELIADKQNAKAVTPLISILNDARTSSGLRNKVALCLSALIINDKHKDSLEPETVANAADALKKCKALLEAENKATSDQGNALQLISQAIDLLSADK